MNFDRRSRPALLAAFAWLALAATAPGPLAALEESKTVNGDITIRERS